MRKTIIIITCSSLISLAFLGCKEEKIYAPQSTCPKEYIVEKLIRSYETKNIGLYESLLHDNYAWYFQERDVKPGEPPFWSKEEDVRVTRNIFLAASGQYQPAIESLELKILEGQWYKVDSIAGEYCKDCWMTERSYQLIVVIGETLCIGHDLVQLYIVPIKDSCMHKYKIILAYDIDSSRNVKSAFGTEISTWGGIKSIYR